MSTVLIPKPVTTFSVEAACVTHRGAVRKKNEDALFCGQVIHGETMEHAEMTVGRIGPPWTMVVADGIGGNLAGERASHEAVEFLSKLKNYSEEALYDALLAINDRLQDLGDKDANLHGMGTTVAGLACGSDGMLVYHLGDSRVYRIQDGFLSQLTKDDSVAEMLRGQDDFPVDELPASIRRALTQCLGGKFNEDGLKPHFLRLQLREPTRFLLCTDGVSETLSHEKMEAIISSHDDMIAMVEDLAKETLQRGAKDNMTIILAEISPIEKGK